MVGRLILLNFNYIFLLRVTRPDLLMIMAKLLYLLLFRLDKLELKILNA